MFPPDLQSGVRIQQEHPYRLNLSLRSAVPVNCLEQLFDLIACRFLRNLQPLHPRVGR